MSKRKKNERLDVLYDPKAASQVGGQDAWRLSKRKF
jgi:hypothetical protein